VADNHERINSTPAQYYKQYITVCAPYETSHYSLLASSSTLQVTVL